MGCDKTHSLVEGSFGRSHNHRHEEHTVWQELESEGDNVKGHELFGILLGV